MAKRKCSVEGCEKKHQARGLCAMHYWRFRTTGDVGGAGSTYGAAMAFLTNLPETDECIEFPYCRDKRGYGQLQIEGKSRKATHIALELAGKPRPQGLLALHSCHNPPCVNPRHLRWGTHQDNMDDRGSAGNTPRRERHPRAKLTEAQVLAIYADPRTYAPIASDYGIAPVTVCSIKTGNRWSWLTNS